MRESIPQRQLDTLPSIEKPPATTGRNPSFSDRYAGPFFDTSGEEKPSEEKENSEWVKWNKNITLTFDDSSAYILNIASFLEKNGCKNYRFYINAGEDLRPEFMKKIGVSSDGKEITEESKPGAWFNFVTREARKQKISTADYLRQYAIKKESLDNGQKIKEYFQKEYPEDWEKRLTELIQYHAGVMHPAGASKHHIQNWTEEQIKEDIKFFEEYVKAMFGLKEYKISHMRLPGGWGAVPKHESHKKFAKIAQELNCSLDYWDAEWNPQIPVATGSGDKKSVAERAVHFEEAKKSALLLMHTRHYQTPEEIEIKLIPILDEITKEYNLKKTE